MKYSFYRIFFALVFSFCFLQSGFSNQDEEINKTFSKKDNLKISVASANCFLKKSNTNEIKVRITHTYDKNDYIPEFTEESNKLVIKEVFKENNMHGKAQWFIEIPDNTEISFNSASGNVEAVDLKCNLKLNTASGNVKINKVYGELTVHTASGNAKLEDVNTKVNIKTASGNAFLNNADAEISISTASGGIKSQNIKGKVNLNTASGNISVKGMTGEMKAHTASGDIEGVDMTLIKATSFGTASGDVEIRLSKSPVEELSFSTASGDVKLDFNGNTINGYFELKAKAHSGNIDVPSGFNLVSSDEDDSMIEKIYKSGTGTPKIKMNTASGSLKITK